MSKTPRTEEQILHHDNGNGHPSDFVFASFARQLETELADARAEIERLRARNAILDNAIAEVTEEQAALCAEGQTITELVAAKNKLIEQMRDEITRLKGVVISQITPEPFVLSSYSSTAEPVKDGREESEAGAAMIRYVCKEHEFEKQLSSARLTLIQIEKDFVAETNQNLARATEIERKDKLIEQMRDALQMVRATSKSFLPGLTWQAVIAALDAAERGE